MELTTIDTNKKLSLNEGVFGKEFKEDLIHQVVNAFRAASRAGTKAQKSRAEVTGTTKKLSLNEGVFGKEFKEDLIHQVVNAFRAASRAGTKAQKTRAEVKGTTKKFKKQKGGGARHGDYRAPIFVGGGVSFAAKPRDFTQKVNKKMYRGAIASILSELVRQDRLRVVDAFDLDEGKTKLLASKLKDMNLGRTLVVTESGSENLFRAARNIRSVAVIDASAIDPVTLIHAEHVVMTAESVKKVEEWLA